MLLEQLSFTSLVVAAKFQRINILHEISALLPLLHTLLAGYVLFSVAMLTENLIRRIAIIICSETVAELWVDLESWILKILKRIC